MDFSFLEKTQPKVVKLLQNSLKKNRLSQVYLFDGAKGTPKFQAAMYLAYLVLCDTHNMCGKCLNCRRLEENFHPRLFKLEPSKNEGATKSIKKEQIDSLVQEFNYNGIESGPRVFIINEIDKTNPASANSLLKFLEEMKDECYGVLITDNINAVIGTIKSRSQVVTFDKISSSVLKEAFLSKGIDSELAQIMCTITNNVQEGLELLEDENIRKIIELVRKINKSFFTDDSAVLIMNEDGKFLLQNSEKFYHNVFISLLITITNDRLFYLIDNNYDLNSNCEHNSMSKTIVFDKTINEMNDLGIKINKIDYEHTFKQMEILLEYKKRLNYYINLELFYMDLFNMCEEY